MRAARAARLFFPHLINQIPHLWCRRYRSRHRCLSSVPNTSQSKVRSIRGALPDW